MSRPPAPTLIQCKHGRPIVSTQDVDDTRPVCVCCGGDHRSMLPLCLACR